MTINFQEIGVVHSCFKQKFGIPRQPGLVSEAKGVIELYPPLNTEHVVRGLEGFSHLWVLFLFHETPKGGWRPTVRPPRLGGKRRVGVFASRSPFRPNPIGLSVVRLDAVRRKKGELFLDVSAIDMVDGTPVIDIKPYVPYSDSIADAVSGYAAGEPDRCLDVEFAKPARDKLADWGRNENGELETLIVKMLRTDPRPAYYSQKHYDAEFSFKIFDVEVKWEVSDNRARVTDIVPLKGLERSQMPG